MQNINIKNLGLTKYQDVWEQMKTFTQNRTENTIDEIWITEHFPVYTLGLAGKIEHLIINPQNIPLIKTDRGGQITFHAPDQIVIYLLINIEKNKIGVRQFVNIIEQAVIDFFNKHSQNFVAVRESGKPGVYVKNKKIAALGLKVKKGCTYHGLAINVNMDLSAFENINPCGYAGMKVANIADLGIKLPKAEIADKIIFNILENVY